MKKIILIIAILAIPLLADARGSISSSHSSSFSSRSSGYSSYSSPKSTSSSSSYKGGITTSSKPISQTTGIKSGNETNYNSTSFTNYRGGGDYNSGFNSPFLSSLGGSVVGSIAGNMIYDALTPDQHTGNTVNDGKVQYAEILNGSGQVVGYKPTGQIASNTETSVSSPVEEDHTVAWLWFFGIMITLGMIMLIPRNNY